MRTRLFLGSTLTAAMLAGAARVDQCDPFKPPEFPDVFGARNMIVNSPIFNEISGKLGGAVGITSRFGMQLRGLVTGSNPQTEPQFIVRNILASLANTWRETLTQTERGGWEELADDTPGASSGMGLFVKGNSERLRADAPYVATAPSSASALFTPPDTIVVDDSANNLTFNFGALDDPWQTADGWMNVYVTRQQPQSRNTRIHPFIHVAAIEGDTVGAQTVSLAGITNTTAGKIMYVKFTTVTADARRSQDFVARVLEVA